MVRIVYILGLATSHNSTAVLLKDGKVKYAVSEEKFNRIKNSGVFPSRAISWILRTEGIGPGQISAVAVAGLYVYPENANIGGGSGNVPAAASGLAAHLASIYRYHDYKKSPVKDLIYPFVQLKEKKRRSRGRGEFLAELAKHGIGRDRVHFVEHHVCHAYTAFYGLGASENDSLVLTLDGAGDYYCAGVNVANVNGMERISSTPWTSSIGYVYALTTVYLGMKAMEHEYKVMGLAPYAKDYYLKTYERLYKNVISLDREDPTRFASRFNLNRFDLYLKENAYGERFDNIAASVQKLTEEKVTEWAKACMERTGLDTVYTCGGVFMNVKLNLRLAKMGAIRRLNLMPSCGDESNAFGAAYYVYTKILEQNPKSITPLREIYLGPEYSNRETEEYLKTLDRNKYSFEYCGDIEGTVAELLVKGEIVARVSGKCEFGARALGNRSILGDPSKMGTFYKINDQIKMRDFWMPFAPVMLERRAGEYIEKPDNVDAPYMIIAFDSTEEGRKNFRAALHQADKTLRPQVLERDWNPGYYKIIENFEGETGIGGLLNTSFNLHGEPIANSPQDAIHTMENSGLKWVAIGNWLVEKK